MAQHGYVFVQNGARAVDKFGYTELKHIIALYFVTKIASAVMMVLYSHILRPYQRYCSKKIAS